MALAIAALVASLRWRPERSAGDGMVHAAEAARESASFFSFCPAPKVRTPLELIRHMESVLGYARTFFLGGEYNQDPLPDQDAEIRRFHATLEDLSQLLASEQPLTGITAERLLQGPFSDAMTHAGKLALLRRLAGSPVPPENFIYADIQAENVSPNQPAPIKPGNRHGGWEEEEAN